ncbi:MAG: phosphate acyltransferase PlsX [Planctomycetes bacterium]|nr:phosphate acyltransferase PlsX [Planctomycetota bacterium]
MTKVVLDAVGGDHAPKEAVRGAALALERKFISAADVILTGPRDVVRQALTTEGLAPDLFAIEDAPDVLVEGDTPTDAMRKKPRNSIAVGIQAVKEGRAKAFISAGSTGTVVAAATLGLRCLEGIRRPAIGAIIHGEKHPFLVIDVGANPQPKPLHLAQYGIMGSAYYRGTFGVENPRVGILNIGSEELKGTPLVKEARQLLRQMPITFHGNVEGVEVFSGDCHVVVSDGFTGNVLLKVSEGVAEYVVRTVVGLMKGAQVEKEKIQQVLAGVMPRIDFSEYGGALLLGVEGLVTICHGRSTAPAFANAIRFARKADEAQVNQHIVEAAKIVAAANGDTDAGAGGR